MIRNLRYFGLAILLLITTYSIVWLYFVMEIKSNLNDLSKNSSFSFSSIKQYGFPLSMNFAIKDVRLVKKIAIKESYANFPEIKLNIGIFNKKIKVIFPKNISFYLNNGIDEKKGEIFFNQNSNLNFYLVKNIFLEKIFLKSYVISDLLYQILYEDQGYKIFDTDKNAETFLSDQNKIDLKINKTKDYKKMLLTTSLNFSEWQKKSSVFEKGFMKSSLDVTKNDSTFKAIIKEFSFKIGNFGLYFTGNFEAFNANLSFDINTKIDGLKFFINYIDENVNFINSRALKYTLMKIASLDPDIEYDSIEVKFKKTPMGAPFFGGFSIQNLINIYSSYLKISESAKSE